MKKLLLFTLFVSVSSIVFCQPEPIKWGKVSQEELEMTFYPEDSSAEAVVLCDYGKAAFNFSVSEGFRIEFNRITRIKILNEEGLEWANQKLYFSGSGSTEEKLTSLKGYTYNLVDGKEVKEKLRKEDIFKEDKEHGELVTFTFPQVKVGSVIEFDYTMLSDYLYHFVDWRFQRSIPTIQSEFRATIPEYYYYKHFMRGYFPPAVNDMESVVENFSLGGGEVIRPQASAFRWVMQHVPALRTEPFMTTPDDYISKIEFELLSIRFPNSPIKTFSKDWAQLNKELLDSEYFGTNLNKEHLVEEEVATIISNKTTENEKLTAIYDYVRNTYQFNGDNSLYTDESMRSVIKDKKGNSTEINFVLLLMLRNAGLKADPVIASTRTHGKPNPVVPMRTDYNYTIIRALVDNTPILLDATSKHRPAGMLPYKCMNGQGRVVSLSEELWLDLNYSGEFEETSKGVFTINSDGSLQAEITLSSSGYSGLEKIDEFDEQGEEQYLKTFADELENWTINDHSINMEGLPQGEFSETIETQIPEANMVAGDMLYLNLFPLEGDAENPFKAETRVYPVDIGCAIKESNTYQFTLPEGYEIASMPQNVVWGLPNKAGYFRYSIIPNGETQLMVVARLQITKPFFLPEEYEALKEFFRLIVDKKQEQLVLKKKVS